MLAKGDPKVIRAWTFYDWANSVYPLVISSAIFPIFYEKITRSELGGVIDLFGFHFSNTEFYSYTAALSYIIVAFSSPVLSGIADYSGSKKKFLQFFCYLGAACCMLLALFSTAHIGLSMLALMFASVGYWGSLVFYNAYLPEIAPPEDQDRVSAKGFSMGYIGSSTLLILILCVFVFGKLLPITYCFLLVGIWWIGFAQVTFKRLPSSVHTHAPSKENALTKGYRELMIVFRDILSRKQLRRFLGSYFMYNMGVQTVMIMAVLFATKAIVWHSQEDIGLSIQQVNEDSASTMKMESNWTIVMFQVDTLYKLNSAIPDNLSVAEQKTEQEKNLESVVGLYPPVDPNAPPPPPPPPPIDDIGPPVERPNPFESPDYPAYVQSVYEATEKAADGHRSSSLIISILLIQFLGVAGAFLMSRLSKGFGNLKTIGVVILLWVVICFCVYKLVYTPVQFYIAAASVGLVMGGIQALSRSTYSKMLPETEDHASYFSFFDVSEKIGLAIGTISFGYIAGVTGGIRNSVLSIIITFVIGFLLLLRVPKSDTVK